MHSKEFFEERYKSNDMPWDNDRPDSNLVNLLAKKIILDNQTLKF